MFRSQDHLQGATLLIAKVTFLKTFSRVLWEHAATAPC